MLSVEMLPAQYGDCLWIEYGDEREPRRILVDCGMKSTYRLLSKRLRKSPDLSFELLVLTHVDADHIQGSIPLLKKFGPERFKEVWFNRWKQLPPDDSLGAVQGEIVSALLEQGGFACNRKAIVVPDRGKLPSHTLAGGLKLTLLSPTPGQLVDLRLEWRKVLAQEKMRPGNAGDALRRLETRRELQPDRLGRIDVFALARTRYEPDKGAGNGSSIALLAEFDDRALLLAGDAFAPVLEQTIARLLQERRQEGPLRLDAFKLSHHGSRGNTSPDLLGMVACRDFLISTNGSSYHHPHEETVARVILSQEKPRLHFNYQSDENKVWASRALQRDFSYESHYPKAGAEGYKLTL
jgi:beta-lactamase superfamily II metal-dependent hydrolase